MTATPFEAGNGVVESFDEPRGLGTIRVDDGGRLPFHCTAISDGTRTIAVGTPVRFLVLPGRQGRWEATQVRPS